MSKVGRVKASSILEVIVSMILILVAFTIAMMISANVLRSSLSLKKLNAQTVLHGRMIELEQNGSIEESTYTVDELAVVQNVKAYQQIGLLEVRLLAYDDNKQLLAEVRKVIPEKR